MSRRNRRADANGPFKTLADNVLKKAKYVRKFSKMSGNVRNRTRCVLNWHERVFARSSRLKRTCWLGGAGGWSSQARR